jgi:decaprenylphospho-beta-D-erythro-pentofuranosid-2-ulose 2-reductase
MNDGLGRMQNVLVLGGTSEIGCATADALVTGDGTVVLAGRDPEALSAAAARLARPRRRVDTVYYDATGSAQATVDLIAGVAERIGDLDVVLVCVGVLADQALLDRDTVATEESLRTNLLGPAVAAHAAAVRLAAQGHGTLVVLSSVAALRPRRALLTYASAKAGLDAYARGLDEMVHGSGARVLVVRPGHVRTRMTAGLQEPPFTVDAAQVAAGIHAALRSDARVAYVPAPLRPVMTVLRALPAPIFRRVTAERARSTPPPATPGGPVGPSGNDVTAVLSPVVDRNASQAADR